MTAPITQLSSQSPDPAVGRTPATASASLAVGYLRAFVTLLVLAHHAALAYHAFAPPPPTSLLTEPRWWLAFPIVDSARSSGVALLVGFNDTFFMALMFLLSGLFVGPSVRRRGIGHFLRHRAVRLGVPFVVSALVLAPLAYYPSYLQTQAGGGWSGYLEAWLAIGFWPAGPAWFLWLLLAFDAIAAIVLTTIPASGKWLARATGDAGRRPLSFFGLLVLVSAVAYIPLAPVFNPMVWTSVGPFTFQTSRVLHYLVYFLTGVGIGLAGIEHGLLAGTGRLARRWFVWLGVALVAFAAATITAIVAMQAGAASTSWIVGASAAFVVSCAATSLALIAVFVRFATTPWRLLDSLRDNAYGIYLVHYAIVSWLQYALLPASLSGLTKAALVLAGTVALSWGASALLRRVPGVARVV